MTTPALLDEQLQPTYDGLAEGRRLAEHGMALVEAASTEEQRAAIDQVIDEYAAAKVPFSLNDIRDRMPAARPSLRGARVTHAARRGVIVDTRETVPSSLPSTRGHKLTVWIGA